VATTANQTVTQHDRAAHTTDADSTSPTVRRCGAPSRDHPEDTGMGHSRAYSSQRCRDVRTYGSDLVEHREEGDDE